MGLEENALEGVWLGCLFLFGDEVVDRSARAAGTRRGDSSTARELQDAQAEDVRALGRTGGGCKSLRSGGQIEEVAGSLLPGRRVRNVEAWRACARPGGRDGGSW